MATAARSGGRSIRAEGGDDPSHFFQQRVGIPADAGEDSLPARGDRPNPPSGNDSGQALLVFCGITNQAKYGIEVRATGHLTDKEITAITEVAEEGAELRR